MSVIVSVQKAAEAAIVNGARTMRRICEGMRSAMVDIASVFNATRFTDETHWHL
jgi:hypothetical protein